MAEPEASPPGEAQPEERISPMQEIYDNVWLLFLASGVVILVFYLIWGLIDLVNIPTLP